MTAAAVAIAHRFAKVVAQLTYVFGPDVLDEALGVPLVLADFKTATAAAQAGELDCAEFTLHKLSALARELHAAATADPGIGEEFRRRFRSETSLGNYLGVRAELSAAVLLLDVGLSIRRGAPPPEADLVVAGSGGSFGVECASLHTTSPNADVLAKVEHLVTRKKGGRDYCCPSSVLFLDATAVFGGINTTEAPDRIREFVARTRWGLVLVPMVIRLGDGRLVRAISRYPGPQTAPSITALLALFDEHLESATAESLGPILVPERP